MAVRTTLLAGLGLVLTACPGDIGQSVGRVAGGSGALCSGDPDPGRVTLHRLNRAEYNNTVRDLTGMDLRPADGFPADDSGYGFDNNADVLTVSPLLVEKYERAADLVAAAVLEGEPATGEGGDGTVDQLFEAEQVGSTEGRAEGNAWRLGREGAVSVRIDLPGQGEYALMTRLWGERAGPDLPRATLWLDGQVLDGFDVDALAGAPVTLQVTVQASAGPHDFAVSFDNDHYDEITHEDRNLYVDWLAVRGDAPADAPAAGAARSVVTCDPAELGEDDCARQILHAFARRAWRRPVEDDEVDRLLQLHAAARADGEDFHGGLRLALQGILLSPHFLFRVEIDPEPDSDAKHPLSDHELATRLSYLLWSSMPDAELLAAADSGFLQDGSEVEAQVRRMLDDPRAYALIENFGGQWLKLRELSELTPNGAMYPEWDEALRDDFRAETEAFLESFLRDGEDLRDLVTADWTFANERLADFYGIEGVTGDALQRVSLGPGRRVGLLTQGAWLAVTSHATRTSPVLRGKWVLTNLLCEAPQPPPPNVPALPEGDGATGSVRQRMEQHRSDPVCAGCHASMDPIGFGLENFDAIGQWRDQEEGGYPIDATGTMPNGRSFDGSRELAAILHDDPGLGPCLTERVFTYALGRGPEDADHCDLDGIAGTFGDRGYRLDELLVLIATSDAFRSRRGEP